MPFNAIFHPYYINKLFKYSSKIYSLMNRAQLDMELNIDHRPSVESVMPKSARASVLGKLKGYTAQESPDRKIAKPSKEER